MDPVTAVASALGSLFDGVFGIFNATNQSDLIAQSQMPDWISYNDINRKDNTYLYISILLVIAILIIGYFKIKK